MASSSSKFSMILLLLSCSIFLQGIMGEIICENLPVDVCAFSIDSSGKRCLLENFQNGVDGQMEFQCGSSEVVVRMMAEHIESQFCIDACEVDRKTVGISSDALLDTHFMSMLCSDECFHNCPNIVNLYTKLAAGEGMILRVLCDRQRRPGTKLPGLWGGIGVSLDTIGVHFPRQNALDLDVASVPAFSPVPRFF